MLMAVSCRRIPVSLRSSGLGRGAQKRRRAHAPLKCSMLAGRLAATPVNTRTSSARAAATPGHGPGTGKS